MGFFCYFSLIDFIESGHKRVSLGAGKEWMLRPTDWCQRTQNITNKTRPTVHNVANSDPIADTECITTCAWTISKTHHHIMQVKHFRRIRKPFSKCEEQTRMICKIEHPADNFICSFNFDKKKKNIWKDFCKNGLFSSNDLVCLFCQQNVKILYKKKNIFWHSKQG